MTKDKPNIGMTPSGGAYSKKIRYGWSPITEPGKFCWVEKGKLHIPVESYQRDASSDKKIKDMVRNWDWRACGALSVVKRRDGTMSVYDGGHRTRAAMKRDDITIMPCMVFEQTVDTEGQNVKEEARSFIGKNTKQSIVRAYDLHRAGVVAEDEIDVAAAALLKKIGYTVKKDAASRYGIAAIGTVKRLVKKDRNMADYIMCKLATLADGEPIPAMIMRAFAYLYSKGIDFEETTTRNKLKKTTLASLVTVINREKHIMNQGGERIEAKAVLDFLNKSRRKKLRIDI